MKVFIEEFEEFEEVENDPFLIGMIIVSVITFSTILSMVIMIEGTI